MGQMGREIRKVPKDWEHPKDCKGHFKPLYDGDYDEAALEWIEGFRKWESGEDPNKATAKSPYYWDWDGPPPDRDYYHPAWLPEEVVCYQIYETVSEGTPISPVFEDKESLIGWLIKEGYSEKAAICFAEAGWAPSMMFILGEGLIQDIESCRSFPNCGKE